METIDLIGLFGAFLSGVTFFPQVYRTWKLKSARDLSLTMILIILLSNVVWLIYAFEKQDVAIIAANFFVGTCAIIILYFKIKFKQVLKRYLFFIILLISCNNESDEILEIGIYDDCDFIDDKIYEIDLFEGYLTLKLNNAYVPDFNFTDSLLNDYYYLKFSNDSIDGTYVITDANVRYKINRIQPYDSISINEYPFNFNVIGEKVCVYLDFLKSENCDC